LSSNAIHFLIQYASRSTVIYTEKCISPKTTLDQFTQTKKEKQIKKGRQPKSSKGKGKTHNNQQKKNTKGKKNKSTKKQTPKTPVEQELTLEEEGRYVALDCEFVGVGPGGYKSALARVSLVDYNNAILLDTHVKVDTPVTDYRTFVSGITEEHIQSDTAMDADKCTTLVAKMLKGKILVGHGLKNDLDVLGFTHPWCDTRDTAKYEPFLKKAKKNVLSTLPMPRKLKDLALTKLGREIQKVGESHCSIEDAIAALDLYKKASVKWEDTMKYKANRTREINCQ
jgi:RNA exonuclease 4